MGSDIEGIIEVKENGRWRCYHEIDFDLTRDYSLWCHLFGVRCDDDKCEGIFNNNRVSRHDCSPYLKGMFEDEMLDDVYGPYYIGVDDIGKIEFDSFYSQIYKDQFDLMQYELRGKYEDVRMVVWID